MDFQWPEPPFPNPTYPIYTLVKSLNPCSQRLPMFGLALHVFCLCWFCPNSNRARQSSLRRPQIVFEGWLGKTKTIWNYQSLFWKRSHGMTLSTTLTLRRFFDWMQNIVIFKPLWYGEQWISPITQCCQDTSWISQNGGDCRASKLTKHYWVVFQFTVNSRTYRVSGYWVVGLFFNSLLT